MNLKEAFRYQKFLDSMMQAATNAMRNKTLCLNTEKTHHYNKADASLTDVIEVEEKTVQYQVEDLVSLGHVLIGERRKLTHAINVAKANADIDIDAYVEANKFAMRMISGYRTILSFQSGKHKERGSGYRLNGEGNQTGYVYEIDVVDTEAYDRKDIKKQLHEVSVKADEVSSQIDSAMVNTLVDYDPIYDVNETLDDIMAEFVQKREVVSV